MLFAMSLADHGAGAGGDGPLSETATPMSDAPAIEPDSESLFVSDGGWTLDLDVFEGPFDLLIPLILNEEIDLLEVTLAEIVLTYIERLDARGELDLEAATEFLVLIAALLEL